MTDTSYLALHRAGRLYGPTDQELVLRTPFEVQQFTRDAQGSLRSSIDTDAFRELPLSPRTLRDLRYLWDVERSTMGQVRHVVVGYTNKESRIAAFLTTWVYERHWIADAYQAILEVHGEDVSAPVTHDHLLLDRVEISLDHLAPATDSVWTNLFGEDVVAGQTARGWSREASTRAALTAVDDAAGHRELSALLKRVDALSRPCINASSPRKPTNACAAHGERRPSPGATWGSTSTRCGPWACPGWPSERSCGACAPPWPRPGYCCSTPMSRCNGHRARRVRNRCVERSNAITW